jgi:AcrR family transcriptional regulator
MNKRERNRLRNRRRMARIALELFLENGFDGTTIDEIADRAGVSSRTFFRYFPTKEVAFFANQEERLGRFQEALAEEREGENAYERVRRVCLEEAARYMEERDVETRQYEIVMASNHLLAYDLQLDQAWEQAIYETLVQGGHAERVALVVAGAVIGVIRAQLRTWFRAGSNYDIVERGRDAFVILEAAFET